MQPKLRKIQVSFGYAIRSFMGYLEGTQKAHHTIKNYRLDLLAFQDFITKEYSNKLFRVDQVSLKDLNHFGDYLKEKGLKANTRRRQILTLTQFISYLSKRKKLSPEIAKKIPAPHKLERIPFAVSQSQLLEAIQKLGDGNLLEARNKVLLWTLAETGCLVSEVGSLRFESWRQTSPTQATLCLGIKALRQVPVSVELFLAIQSLKKMHPTQSSSPDWIFHGFNKFGSMGSPISSRGVEHLVKLYGPRLGFSDMTPRTFRHSTLLHWLEKGISEAEIQDRLGLKTRYAFRSYEALIKSNSETTSISETTPTES